MPALNNERDSQTEELRYELKTSCPAYQLARVHAWVVSHPGAFKKAFPPRWVNNVYFDTWEYDSLNDHLEGIEKHQKLRLRWYGPSYKQIQHAYLELKQRMNRVGRKDVQVLDCDFDLEKLTWSEIMAALKAGCDEHFSPIILSVRPVLISRFYREYYVTADGETRLTLDYHLQSFDQRFSRFPNIRYSTPLLDDLIVEVKSGVETADRLSRLLANFPFRFDKYSKYVSSLQSILD